ncbi:MAG: M56 family metallopeptidase [Muribaculaceae bacterium]|nr:M56 family metallopeptidase [Muribaculaceae bacterium]
MGTYLAFTLYSGTFLLTFYIAYRLVAARQKQFKRNRIILIAIYAISLSAWPLSRTDSTDTQSETKGFKSSGIITTNYTMPTSDIFPIFTNIIAGTYLSGMIAILSLTLLNITKTVRTVKRAYLISQKDHTLAVIPGEEIAPFSFFKYIVIGSCDLSEERRYVVEHEQAHIHRRHFLDLLLAQAVCIAFWYNPAAWRMRKELELLHEFQADADVLSSGADRKEYQLLLLRTAAGKRYKTMANSLHHSDIKVRINMMNKQRSKGVRRLIPFTLITAPVIASGALNNSIVTAELTRLQSYSLTQIFPSTDNNVNSDVQYVDLNGIPITTIAFVTDADPDTVTEEEPINLPLSLDEMKGMIFFVNGRLLPKDEEPMIFVNGRRWTHPYVEIESAGIESFSFREDKDGNPYGIVDITLKQ